jgi:3',5'-cyclic AMP phosphodiesterase CpdA
MKKIYGIIILLLSATLWSQKTQVPASFHNIEYQKGILGVSYEGKFYPRKEKKAPYLTYSNLATPDVKATDQGVILDFRRPEIEGTVYFGLIDDKSRYKQPVFSKVKAKIKNGKAFLKIAKLKGKYDFTGWEESGDVKIGYRVADKKGRIITENRLYLKYFDGKFHPSVSLIEGPFLSMPVPDGMTVYFVFDKPVRATLEIDGQIWDDGKKSRKHIYRLSGLQPATEYDYTIVFEGWKETYRLKTAVKKGYDQGFSFAYASDSRGGTAGGERNIYGTNAYILKRIFLAADHEKTDFFLFTGDMVTGYKTDKDQLRLEYFNFKNAVRYYSPYRPIFVGIGNHEALSASFYKFDSDSPEAWKRYISVDRFPFDTQSAESLFAEEFEMPGNGPSSEDGSRYDPDLTKTDFPPYKETVYSFTYGNTGFVMLNADYWYTTNENYIPLVGGNPHGYVMDRQLEWLRRTIRNMESDTDIDHIIVTIHITPFPNAGHADDGMWYYGNNQIRPYIAGKPVEKGIIERRDELVDILVNHSRKFRALLVGDEHNYTRLVVDKDTEIYPENWQGERLKLSRPFVQITNGAAGAPYYALQDMPWKNHVRTFSTQNAIMIFHVDKEKISVKVYNPDTFEEIEHFDLK